MFLKSAISSAVVVATLGLAACGGGTTSSSSALAVAVSVSVGDTIALSTSGRLFSFNRAAPGTQVGSVAVSGLVSGETLLGIDVRPANGTLYGLGSNGGIYRIDPATGIATVSSTLRAAPGDDNPFTALAGTSFGVDFNPVADRLRVVSNTGQNLRINVETGDAITDLTIAPATAAVSASAYTNAFAGTTTTRLFNLNLATNTVDLQDPPNNGTLVTGTSIGLSASAVNGFDIDARDNVGYAALTVGGTTALYRVDLSAVAPAVATTLVGTIAGGDGIRGLALVQPTVAVNVTGLTTDNRLVGFNPRSPNTLSSDVAITGLNPGESILGIDFRPADSQLWALSSAARLYTLNPVTGAATFRVALSAEPTDVTAPFTGLDGSATLSVDFNPVPDRMRVITPAGQNLRINVATGATITDGTINRISGPASVLGAAYTNSFAGTTSTRLFDLESNNSVLALQNPPNDGTLVNVGALGLNITGMAGLDIAGGDNGLVLAALRTGTTGAFTLRSISLLTGASSLYGNSSGDASLSLIGGLNGPQLRDIAISRL